MGCQQCLPFSVVQLKGKHCRKSHCRNGVVDTFGHNWTNFHNFFPDAQNNPYMFLNLRHLYNHRFYNETICQIGTPYINEKFTVNDLRENIDDERLVELFKKILEAERHAQTQKCYFTPCGIIPESSDPFKNNQNNQEGDSSSSIVMIDTFILILHTLLLVMA